MKPEPSAGDREARRAVEAAVLQAVFGLLLMVCGALLACRMDDPGPLPFHSEIDGTG
jgi:hypothetical protein